MGICRSKLPKPEVPPPVIHYPPPTFGPDFPTFTGPVVKREDTLEYINASHQYATSSQGPLVLAPAAVIYAANEEDIIKAINYAHKTGVAIGVRSGGHHYMGASSTAGNNLQLDLSGLRWTDPDNPYPYTFVRYDQEKNIVTAGPGVTLDQFSEFMNRNNIFLPFGECPRVHLGGHAQTGGTGTASRTFGLLCDYCHSITLITAEGKGDNIAVKRKLYRDSTNKEDQDLFFSTIGGSPGNFGVVVEVEFKPLKDVDFPHSRSLQLVYVYTEERYRRLLNLYAKWCDEGTLPQAFSFSLVAVGSAVVCDPDQLDASFKESAPELYWAKFGEGEKIKVDLFNNPFLRPCSTIVVNALWADATNPNLPFEDCPEAQAFFQKIKDTADGTSLQDWITDMISLGFDIFGKLLGSVFDCKNHIPLSEMMRRMTIPMAREWPLPFHHRFMLSPSRSLIKDGFVETTIQRFNPLLAESNPEYAGFKASEQYIPLGPNSAWHTKADGKTAVSWRGDSWAVGTATFFFPAGKEALANKFSAGNHAAYIGPKGTFSPVDRRFVWAPYGNSDWNMDASWEFFFDSRAKYERVLATKRLVDPHDVFTPNLFCVGASTSKKLQKNMPPTILKSQRSMKVHS